MLLPGGLLRAGERMRRAALREPDGRLELAIAEHSKAARSLPELVSAVLARALKKIDNEAATPELVAELCIADRQFLMHRLAEMLGLGEPWITAVCAACGERFDFSLRLADLPVRGAGTGFPFAVVETSAGSMRFRVPNGADQELVANQREAREAEEMLIARCAAGEGPVDIEALTDEDIARIEAALEDVSPAVVTRVSASCPACGAPQEVPLDPYLALRVSSASLLDEVHALASAYHWSEREILSLPLSRRRLYIARVDRARGVVS